MRCFNLENLAMKWEIEILRDSFFKILVTSSYVSIFRIEDLAFRIYLEFLINTFDFQIVAFPDFMGCLMNLLSFSLYNKLLIACIQIHL
jgi:hypothetical protein